MEKRVVEYAPVIPIAVNGLWMGRIALWMLIMSPMCIFVLVLVVPYLSLVFGLALTATIRSRGRSIHAWIALVPTGVFGCWIAWTMITGR